MCETSENVQSLTLPAAKKRLAVIKGQMTKLVNYVNEKVNTTTSIEELSVRLDRAPILLKEFTALEMVIFNMCESESSDMSDFEENYYHVVAKLTRLIRERSTDYTPTSLNDSTIQAGIHAAEVKLPKINIPPFKGDYTEWQSFSDLFNTTIHENSSLTPVQKFQYLKGLLRDEAAGLLKHFTITDANYIEALQKLRKRYDQKRHTVRKFIDMFLDMPSFKQADQRNVRALVDTADEVVRGMKALGPIAESRDPWLIRILEDKLDEESRMLWARHTAESNFPTLEEFFDFLQQRANSLESMKSSYTIVKPIPTKIKEFKQTRSLHASTTSVCSVCKIEDHLLINCSKFKGMSVEQRREFIKANNRCCNCFNGAHSSYFCRSKGRCSKCHKKHHVLLHIDQTQGEMKEVTKEPSQSVSGTA